MKTFGQWTTDYKNAYGFDFGISDTNILVFDRFYSESHRKYHGKNHIVDLLNLNEKLRVYDVNIRDRDFEIKTAIFWHDIIYDPNRRDNEITSASLYKLTVNSIQNVVETIIDTQHLLPSINKLKWSLYVLDLDLAGIGSKDYKKFSHNTELIREEAGITAYDDREFAKNRIKFWEMLLARGYIYHNPYNLDFFKEATEYAYKNIDTEMRTLKTLLNSI